MDGTISKIQIGIIDNSWNWSNDGNKIVYAKDENSDPYRSSFYLYIVDIRRPNEQTKITNFTAIEPDLFIPNE